MATIARNFDSVNYVTKTKSFVMTAGSSYTIGSGFNGGEAVDIFVSTDFSLVVGETAKTKDIDYTLAGVDSGYTEDYGTTFFTTVKSLTITGTVTVSYRCHGTYTDAGIINAHETRLDGHDTNLSTISDTLSSHGARMSSIETVNTSQDEDITALQADTATLQSDVSAHVGNTTDPHGAVSTATANKIAIRDASARMQAAAGAADLDVVNKAQMEAAISSAVVAAGEGDVAGPSSSVAGRIATFADATGKIIEDSGVAPSDLYASACATQEVTTADVTITDVKKGTLILTGALTGNCAVYLPAAVWKKTIICDCTGAYTVRVLATGQTTGGVYLVPDDAADVYCDGTNVVKVPVTAQALFNKYSSATSSILDLAVADLVVPGMHYYTIVNTDAASPWGTVSRAYSFGDSTNSKLIAYQYNSKASAVRNRVNGVWDEAWTYLTDGNGNPLHPSVATTASAANAYIGANGTTVLKSTSSRRYKTDIVSLDNADALDALRPVLYKSNPDTVPGDDPTLQHYGFIAEEVETAAPILVQYAENEDGEKIPDGVQYERITVLLVKRIHELEARLKKAGI